MQSVSAWKVHYYLVVIYTASLYRWNWKIGPKIHRTRGLLLLLLFLFLFLILHLQPASPTIDSVLQLDYPSNKEKSGKLFHQLLTSNFNTAPQWERKSTARVKIFFLARAKMTWRASVWLSVHQLSFFPPFSLSIRAASASASVWKKVQESETHEILYTRKKKTKIELFLFQRHLPLLPLASQIQWLFLCKSVIESIYRVKFSKNSPHLCHSTLVTHLFQLTACTWILPSIVQVTFFSHFFSSFNCASALDFKKLFACSFTLHFTSHIRHFDTHTFLSPLSLPFFLPPFLARFYSCINWSQVDLTINHLTFFQCTTTRNTSSRGPFRRQRESLAQCRKRKEQNRNFFVFSLKTEHTDTLSEGQISKL